jgi:hypothetical protein
MDEAGSQLRVSIVDNDHPISPDIVILEERNIQQQQLQQQEERPQPWSAARIACEALFLPCTFTTFILAAPFMLPDSIAQDEYQRDACNKLCCPCQTVMYLPFCCCLSLPVMSLASPTLDYYTTLNMFVVSRCPACIYCCYFCPDIPMDLQFMKD